MPSNAIKGLPMLNRWIYLRNERTPKLQYHKRALDDSMTSDVLLGVVDVGGFFTLLKY